MLILISPAKTLDFETPAVTDHFTQPDFLARSQVLIETLRELAPDDLSRLMKISDKLAELNHQRNMNWQPPFTPDNAKQAVLAFKGDVYTGLEAESFSADDFAYAEQHLRILSGLYGLLRPLDLIQPYRLEMGTKLENPEGSNLYQFWGNQITEAINDLLKEQPEPVVVNLASNEYYKAVKPKLLAGEVITPVFKDCKNGNYKIISFYAKKARGLMAAYIVQNRLNEVEQLKRFDAEGYYYSEAHSSPKGWVFLRDEQ